MNPNHSFYNTQICELIEEVNNLVKEIDDLCKPFLNTQHSSSLKGFFPIFKYNRIDSTIHGNLSVINSYLKRDPDLIREDVATPDGETTDLESWLLLFREWHSHVDYIKSKYSSFSLFGK